MAEHYKGRIDFWEADCRGTEGLWWFAIGQGNSTPSSRGLPSAAVELFLALLLVALDFAVAQIVEDGRNAET